MKSSCLHMILGKVCVHACPPNSHLLCYTVFQKERVKWVTYVTHTNTVALCYPLVARTTYRRFNCFHALRPRAQVAEAPTFYIKRSMSNLHTTQAVVLLYLAMLSNTPGHILLPEQEQNPGILMPSVPLLSHIQLYNPIWAGPRRRTVRSLQHSYYYSWCRRSPCRGSADSSSVSDPWGGEKYPSINIICLDLRTVTGIILYWKNI